MHKVQVMKKFFKIYMTFVLAFVNSFNKADEHMTSKTRYYVLFSTEKLIT